MQKYRKKVSQFLVLAILVAQFFGVIDLQAQTIELLPTSVEIIVTCGDGVAEPSSGEICDPGDELLGYTVDTGTTTCSDFNDIYGDPFEDGTLGCQSDCLAFSTSTCWTCGNGNKEQEEICDGSDFGGATCITYGFSGGSLICTSECQINSANCITMEDPGGSAGGGSSGGGSGQRSGYNPGSNENNETKVVVKGKSYPNSDVHILVDGKVTGIVGTDSKADFYFETTEVSPGVASFGFWSEDIEGLKSTLLTLTFRVTLGAVTTITGVYIAPTINVDQKSVRQGDPITVFGQTVPETIVNIHINSEVEHIEQTNSTENGAWQIVFDTAPLEEDFHTAKANFQLDTEGNVIKSGFSKAVSFAVSRLGGEALCPEGDLNADGRVNLTDFSILLFHWGTDNACADQNQNGNVDLIDFSIMMYYWTG